MSNANNQQSLASQLAAMNLNKQAAPGSTPAPGTVPGAAREIDLDESEDEAAHSQVESEEEEEDEEADAPNAGSPAAADSEELDDEDEESDEAEGEVEAAQDLTGIVPLAAQLQQEITFVVYPEDLDDAQLLPGLNYKNPFSRNGGTLRTLFDNLIAPLTAFGEQKIMLLGDAKQAIPALLPLYEQISAAAFNGLLATSTQGAAANSGEASDEGDEDDNLAMPIDDKIYIQGNNVNMVYFTPYCDLQEAVGVKQIENLSRWLSKLNLSGVKLNILFAYTVSDLLDSNVNLVLNTIGSNEKLDAAVYVADAHQFDFHPELVDNLTKNFSAFLHVTVA